MKNLHESHKENKNRVIVEKALKEDSGRGRARIDPIIRKELSLKDGDVILISNPLNNKKTAAILYPDLKKDKDTNTIRLDASLMRNLNASLNDTVEISKIEVKNAESFTLAGLYEYVIIRNTQMLVNRLESRIITKNDILSFYARGHRIDLVVEDYSPDDVAVRIVPDSKIIISENKGQEYYIKGMDHLKNEEIDDAIACFKKALNIKPKAIKPLIGLGNAYNEKKDYDKAIETCQKILEIDPNNKEAQIIQGYSFYYKSDFEEAIKIAESILNLKKRKVKFDLDYNFLEDPEFKKRAIDLIGLSAYDLGKYDESIILYKRILNITRKSSSSWYNLAKSYVAIRDYNHAEKALKKALKYNPGDSTLFYSISDLFYKIGNYEMALYSCDRCLEIDPNLNEALELRKKINKKMNNNG